MNKNIIKRRYDPTIDRYVKKNIHTDEIYGEGLTDIFKSIGSKLFNKTVKDITKKGVKSASNKAVTKVGEHIGNRAGDKIVQLLQKKQPIQQPIQQTIKQSQNNTISQPLTDFEIAQRLNKLISGGKLMKL